MSVLSNTILAFSMSADAFAAAVSKGVSLRRPKLRQAMRIGLIFGGVEMLTPLAGWCAGRLASSFIAAVDHWVAFGLLALVGGKMMHEGFSADEPTRKDMHNLGLLIVTAIGTSIDAMAVGATLALLDVNILAVAAMIGGATFTMVTIGIMTGHYIGTRAGKAAEVLGGICLITIGIIILVEHLSA